MRRCRAFGGRRVVDQEPGRRDAGRRKDESLDDELQPRVDPGMRRERRSGRPDEDTDTPEAVEARHHRPADELLNQHALRVLRHIGEAGRRTEDEESGAEHHEGGG